MNSFALANCLPWQAKILAKMMLARLPMKYRNWSRLGLFRHGAMDDHTYAWEVLRKHASVLGGASYWSGLELGPGDGVLSALLAPAASSVGLVLVDAGNFADKSVERYQAQLNGFLKAYPEISLPDYSGACDFHELLSKASGRYLSDGLRSLRELPDESFDLIYSQAVLEHVRREEFEETLLECNRVMKPNGIMSHLIDFKDHLGGGLNNLRLPSSLWEASWFAARSGFYTNRLRLSEICNACARAGFEVEIRSTNLWGKPPIERTQLADEFKHLSDDDLNVAEAHLLMRRRPSVNVTTDDSQSAQRSPAFPLD